MAIKGQTRKLTISQKYRIALNSLKTGPIQTGLDVAEFLVFPQLSIVIDWQIETAQTYFMKNADFPKILNFQSIWLKICMVGF